MWNDISTALKDGTRIDLWHKDGFRVTDVWWNDEDEVWTCLFPTSDFTHWMLIERPDTLPFNLRLLKAVRNINLLCVEANNGRI